MALLTELITRGKPVKAHKPWPRSVVPLAVWDAAAEGLAAGTWSLLGLWGEPDAVHMALAATDGGEFGVITRACPDGTFPSVARVHPPALRLERTVHDLFGLRAEGSPDHRPWLDHGRWPFRAPLAAEHGPAPSHARYPFLPVEGESLHQIPVGPVHAGIIEPGHFRFTAHGETVVRLEARLGYVHKGIDGLLAGAPVEDARRVAGRVSGDSTVAFQLAFSRSVEAAAQAEAPPRAQWLRALMAELERIANHLGDIGAVCNDAAFALMHTHCGILREEVLRAADAAFGHRLMMDRVCPGGVTTDLDDAGRARVADLVATIRRRFPDLVELYDATASLQDRTVGTGVVTPELVNQYGAGGYVGRASGRAFDARRTPGYPPYDALEMPVPVRHAGDVNQRVWIRILEVQESLSLIEQLLAGMPEGPGILPLTPRRGAEGLALVEGFRGDVLAWVRMGPDGKVARCHLRDPSWFQWPLLEAAIDGNIVADFPLCNKSFNCSYSGHDL